MTSHNSKPIEEVLSLYRDYGSSSYIGADVTHLQHALQTYKQALSEGYELEILLGAFFHDIGHLLTEQQGLERLMSGEVAQETQSHAEKGQEYLESLGFKGQMSELVAMHVQAKRYFVATIDDYYERLSEASKLALKQHQRGPMSPQEVKEFKEHPLKDIAIKLRKWDDKAIDPTKYTTIDEIEPALEHISQLLYKLQNNSKTS